MISLIFARFFQDISISPQIFQKNSLYFPEFFGSISLNLYDFSRTKSKVRNRPFQNYNLLTSVKTSEYFEKNFGPI